MRAIGTTLMAFGMFFIFKPLARLVGFAMAITCIVGAIPATRWRIH
ncbi:MAG: hypothetical protein ACR2G6_10705 [Gemmatimonadaceae bacterium]